MSNQQYTAKQFIAATKGSHGVIKTIAERLGCSRQTIYNARDKYTTVADAIQNERGIMRDTAENELFKLIQAGNITAIIFFLKCKAGYTETSQFDIDLTSNKKELKSLTAEQLTDDQLAQIIANAKGN